MKHTRTSHAFALGISDGTKDGLHFLADSNCERISLEDIQEIIWEHAAERQEDMINSLESYPSETWTYIYMQVYSARFLMEVCIAGVQVLPEESM